VPIGVSLTTLRRYLRGETGQSLNIAQNVQSQATQDLILDRQQRELWDAYEWPHLRLFQDIPLAVGQSLYAYPTAMSFDQISRIYVADGVNSKWRQLSYGIRAYDIPLAGAPSGNPRQWGNKITINSTTGMVVPGQDQIQLLPVPSRADSVMRLDGQAKCTDLIADGDVCCIDSMIIVLFAAAEILATQKSEAAPFKLTKAQQELRRLLQNTGADKRASYTMGGSYGRVDHLAARPYGNGAVPGIDYIP
jgi:hypothetical protein